MSTTTNVQNVQPNSDAWWEVIAVVGEDAEAVVRDQIATAEREGQNSFGYSSISFWEEEIERAETEKVPPGMHVTVPMASTGPRHVTGLKTMEPLDRTSFDWISPEFDHYTLQINTPSAMVAKFEVWQHGYVSFSIEHSSYTPAVAIERESRLVDKIEGILSRYPAPPPPAPPFRVVMGHGNDQLWRVLRDELREQHGFEVSAFEGQPRAGQTINAVLEDMAQEAAVALIVLTQADEMRDGSWRARQNVVHEVGFFQGRLGWTNAIAVVEEGVDLFSNLDGTQQIRFPKGNISAAVGQVSATLSARERERAHSY